MKPLGMFCAIALTAAAASRLEAAVNPEEFKRIASEVVKVREIARIVERDRERPPGRQRITIVSEIVAVERAASIDRGVRVIVIDYTVDLAAREAAAKAHEAKMGRMPGRQFMHEPEAPELDEHKEFWAHLAPVGGRLANVNRYAGSVVNFEREQFSGPVFVPVAGQYSWDTPSRRPQSGDQPDENAMEKTYTGTLKAGVMAIGAETTGVILETESGIYELDVRANPEADAKVDSLHGKRVVVTGDYQPRPGVEVKERRIIVVRTLREAP